MSIARILSELAVQTPDAALPDSNREAAVKMLLDTCGCAYCGMSAPGISELIGLETELAAMGPGSVFFSDDKLCLPSAVYCNAAMMHALDFDNNSPGADIHILAMVVPIALACGEAFGANGRSCVSSIILGVETAARIAKPYMRARKAHSYFLTTSLVGGWGGVATAARVLGLSVNQTVHAMGIYYAHTCGNRQALLEKALTKRIQPAIAAKAAVYSVLLAQRGVTGPEQVFEGAGGFYRSYTQDPPPPESEFLSTNFRAIEEVSVKHFPTCGVHHANIASALYLKNKYGFESDHIEKVEFFLNEGGGTLVSMPFEPGDFPQVDAQFCAPYAIALALTRGSASVRHFESSRIIQDRATYELAQRTQELTRFTDLDLQQYPLPKPDWKYTKVYLRDGRVLEHGYESAPFNDPKKMPLPRVRDKFRECVSMYGEVESAESERIAEMIEGIESVADVGQWIRSTLGQAPVAHRQLAACGA